MGSAYPRRSRRAPGQADGFLFQTRSNRSGRLHSQGPRTWTHPHLAWQQEGQPLAFGTAATLGGTLQLLYQRFRLGPDVRTRVSLFPILGSPMSESALLACSANAP